MTFDPHFRMYSHDPQQRQGGLATFADLARELADELEDRHQIYPGLVNKGRMTAEAAKREILVMGSLAWHHILPADARPPAPPPVSWSEWVHTLRREIALRRRLYPDRVKSGRLNADVAARKLELLENIHENLWLGCQIAEAREARAATEDRRKALERKAA